MELNIMGRTFRKDKQHWPKGRGQTFIKDQKPWKKQKPRNAQPSDNTDIK